MSNKTDRSEAASALGSHSAKRRLGHLSAAEKSEAMRKVRMAKINKIATQLKKQRPKASDAWLQAQAVFLNQNDNSATYQSILQAQRALGGNDAEEFLDHVLAQLCLLADASSTVTPASITTVLANTKTSIKARKGNY